MSDQSEQLQRQLATLQARNKELDRTLADVYQQRDGLQAQLAQLATFLTAHVPGEPSPTKGSLGAVDCAIHIIINLQAQLRQVEGERAAMKGATNASS